MSRREDVETAIWSDPDFEELSLEASALYLWSFTNPRCGMAGIYKVGRRAMTESKVSPDRLEAVLAELAAAGFAYYEDGVLWVRSRVKHLRTRTEQIAKSIAKDIDRLPAEHPLRRRFLITYADQPWLRDYLRPLVTVPGTSVTLTENGSAEPNGGNVGDVPQGFLGKGKGKGKGEGSSLSDARAVTERLFAYWQQQCNHSDAKFTADRKSKVEARLREGYTEEQVRQAIDGAARAPFIDEKGKRHDDLHLICRNGSKLEDFMGRVGLPSSSNGASKAWGPEQIAAEVAASERRNAERARREAEMEATR